jgi:hypothetical protein
VRKINKIKRCTYLDLNVIYDAKEMLDAQYSYTCNRKERVVAYSVGYYG